MKNPVQDSFEPVYNVLEEPDQNLRKIPIILALFCQNSQFIQ